MSTLALGDVPCCQRAAESVSGALSNKLQPIKHAAPFRSARLRRSTSLLSSPRHRHEGGRRQHRLWQVPSAGSSGDGSSGSGPEDPDLGVPKELAENSRVIFRMAHGVAFGEQLKVVGDGPVLGDWDITKAPTMTWCEGDNWTLEVDIPGGSYDFKFVVQREGAGADDSDWEAGANRSLFVPNMPTSSAITVNGTWSNTSSTFLSMSLDDDDDELEGIWQAALEGAQQSREPEAVRSADLSALGVSTGADVEPLATGEPRAVPMPADLPPASELPSGPDSSTETSDSNADGGSGGSGGVQSGGSEAPDTPPEPQSQDSDHDHSNGSSGGGGGPGSSGNGSGGGHPPLEAVTAPLAQAADSAVSQGMNSAVAPEVDSTSASVGEVIVAAAGIAATGVVAWSLATLKDTGKLSFW